MTFSLRLLTIVGVFAVVILGAYAAGSWMAGVDPFGTAPETKTATVAKPAPKAQTPKQEAALLAARGRYALSEAAPQWCPNIERRWAPIVGSDISPSLMLI